MTDVTSLVARLLPPLLLIVGAMLAIRRFGRPQLQPHRALRVVARTGLTRSAVIAVVAVGGRRFLLGASETGVRMLTELEPETAVQEIPGGTEPATPEPRNGLVDWLRERTVRAAGEGPRRVGGG